MNFTLQNMIEALNTLSIGTIYKYASVGRASSGACELVSVDAHTGAIQYRRNSDGAITPETRIERITGDNVAKLATALDSKNAVEINALYGGSGNFRSALEALVANTANVFVCQVDGKKHIFWNPNESHPVGQITIAEAPAVFVPSDRNASSNLPPPAECVSETEKDRRLDAALKLFAEKRMEDGDGGWFNVGRKVNGRIREYFAPLTKEKLGAFGEGQIEELFCGKKNAEGKIELETMWSGKPGMGWGNIKPTDDSAVKRIAGFLVELKNDAGVSARFLEKGFDCPKGFGPSVITELLMKFHPESCIKHGERSHNALAWLGLIDFAWRNAYSETEYRQVCGAAAKILSRMETMELPRQIKADGSDDGSAPDYLTVNEFLYFVDTNLDEIKEEVMAKQMKNDKPTQYKGKAKLKFDTKDDELMLRLLSALRAKPFAILAGHSGTGKSRYVKKLAYMTCNAEELRRPGQLPGNYLLLPVRPNWHDSTDLLGFRNAIKDGQYQKTPLIEFLFRAMHFKDTPFFLCLDEMNLAPVEQYFAEFLSAMESNEPVPLNDISAAESNLFDLGCEWNDARDYLVANGFSIPKNMFIVGTVNMDETTNQFSRKVLDRAFTIEMTDVDFANYGRVEEPSYDDTLEEKIIKELLSGETVVKKLDEDDVAEGSSLVRVQKALEETAFAIGYRFANEYTLLKRSIACFDPDGRMKIDALDQAVLMKVLPRIAGEREYIDNVYGKLKTALEGKKASLGKIDVIQKRANDTNAQYITFWP